ncbi:hypothetical protein BamMEX5DRAFT_6383 [Burkholderia ambifaria MEX-5]|uniref:Uncharacterized protein n=1 Tax=Burkholderia ambifaria MEX-5 TaxID=396597 RepID=B1TF17_9BURK|nr:hypothetical protein BamMEX5DRAFT_6383 [Burkholderia ambifaria MEX-5]
METSGFRRTRAVGGRLADLLLDRSIFGVSQLTLDFGLKRVVRHRGLGMLLVKCAPVLQGRPFSQVRFLDFLGVAFADIGTADGCVDIFRECASSARTAVVTRNRCVELTEILFGRGRKPRTADEIDTRVIAVRDDLGQGLRRPPRTQIDHHRVGIDGFRHPLRAQVIVEIALDLLMRIFWKRFFREVGLQLLLGCSNTIRKTGQLLTLRGRRISIPIRRDTAYFRRRNARLVFLRHYSVQLGSIAIAH